jgi:hypothetical protein
MSISQEKGASAGLLVSLVLGAGVASSGFAPFNQVADRLGVRAHPILVLITPEVLLGGLALLAAALRPAPSAGRPLRPLVAAGGLLVLAGALSLTVSGDPGDSAIRLFVDVLAPVALAAGLIRADIPRGPLCLAFLVTAGVLWFHADLVFLRDYGWPTAGTLLRAKFTNHPYDFHYYGLGNPDQGALFLILPLTAAAFWALGPITRGLRWVLVALTGVFLASTLLVYVRVGMLAAVVILLAAVLAMPARRRTRAALTGSIAVGAGVLAAVSWSYLRLAASQSADASGVQRITAIGNGFATMWRHPLTGVGLGRYGVSPAPPGHSALSQAAAETGVLGLVAVFAVTVWLCVLAVPVVRGSRGRGLGPGAALAAGAFVIVAAFWGSYITVGSTYGGLWGMSLALMCGVAYGAGPEFALRRRTLAELGAWRLAGGVSLLAVGGLGIYAFLSGPPSSPRLAPAAYPAVAPGGGPALRVWSFGTGVPTGWNRLAGVGARSAPHGTSVTTTPRADYQLTSQPLTLGPGAYDFSVLATLGRGGLAVQVLDLARNAFIARRLFSRIPDQPGPRAFAQSFTVDAAVTHVRLVISNFPQPPTGTSVWIIRNVDLTRSSPGRGHAIR